MSAMLNRTWNYLSQNLASSTLVGGYPGPRWPLPDAQGDRDAHLPPGLSGFLTALYQVTTKEEEATLVHSHLSQIEQKLREKDVKSHHLADALVRAMACHALGYDVEFMHLKALELAQKGSVLEKKMGYLACIVFLEPNDELILLLVNTVIKDLRSKNVMEVNIAINAAIYLTPKEMTPMILPILMDKTTHKNDFIRKKALISLEKFGTRSTDIIPQVQPRVLECLTDSDPGVVATSIQVLKALIRAQSSEKSKENSHQSLLQPLLRIQDQILTGCFPNEYIYKGHEAPFVQVDLWQLIGLILRDHPCPESEVGSLNDSLLTTMDSANIKEAIGQAIVIECVGVIAVMNRFALDAARTNKALVYVNKFLGSSKHNNAKLTGLAALELLLKHSPPALTDVQENNVLECLKHFDDSIRRKTLSLLYVLASKTNVRTIVEKLLEHIKISSDDVQREDLIEKALDLADKFSVSLDWYSGVLLKLIRACTGPASLKEKLIRKMQASLSGEDEDSRETFLKLMNLLSKIVREREKPPMNVLRLYVWCLSRPLARERDNCDPVTEICQIGTKEVDDRGHTNWQLVLKDCLRSLMVISTRDGDCDKAFVWEFLRLCGDSENSPEVSMMAEEMIFLLPQLETIKNAPECDFDCCTLDQFVMDNCGDVYDHRKRLDYQISRPENEVTDGLRFEPYQTQFTLPTEIDARSKNGSLIENDGTSEGRSSATPKKWSLEGRIKEEVSPSEASQIENQDSKNAVSELEEATLGEWSD